jgi:Putative prokaryotic signal transducing protein
MKPLLASLNLLEIHHLKNVLEADGIRCWVKNELLSRLAGEIPFIECAMELHLVREADRPRAEVLLDIWRHPPPPGAVWTCAGCGESVEGQFGECWRCGAARPGGETA